MSPFLTLPYPLVPTELLASCPVCGSPDLRDKLQNDPTDKQIFRAYSEKYSTSGSTTTVDFYVVRHISPSCHAAEPD